MANKEKIARICWNTKGWKRPSGIEGKSKSEETYENTLGFGHEEWLLDDSKIIDGYHYAFLQPINTKNRKHEDETYDIHLITFNTILKQKVYIGCLHNVECISQEKAREIYQIYNEKGWLKELENDVIYAGGTVQDMEPDGLMFNIRFKFKDANISNSNPPIIATEDPNTQALRYILMDKKGDFVFDKDEEGNIKTLETGVFYRTNSSGKILIDPLHKKIQNAVCKLLKKDYSKLSLEEGESSLTSGQRIDLKGIHKTTNEWHYFEIKTNSAKQNIREALGQILEYSHYNHESTRASKLFIVGPEKPDEKDIAYIQKLRNMYNLPIWFRWYSFEDNKLHEGV